VPLLAAGPAAGRAAGGAAAPAAAAGGPRGRRELAIDAGELIETVLKIVEPQGVTIWSPFVKLMR